MTPESSVSVFDLSPSEKLQLVEDLWDDLSATPDAVPIHDWQKEELARRKANLSESSGSDRSWEGVGDRFFNRYGSRTRPAAQVIRKSRTSASLIKGEHEMTRLLERAIEAAGQLPDAEQDAIAALILEELDDDRRWDETFAASQDRLSALAEKVRGDIRAGRVRDGGIDEL